MLAPGLVLILILGAAETEGRGVLVLGVVLVANLVAAVFVIPGRGGRGLEVLRVGAAGVGVAALREGEAIVMASSLSLVLPADVAIFEGLAGSIDLSRDFCALFGV